MRACDTKSVNKEITGGLEISGTAYQADGWGKPRRIVMARQEIEKRPNAAGKPIRQFVPFENENDFGISFICHVR